MSKARQTYKVAPCLQHQVSARWSHKEVIIDENLDNYDVLRLAFISSLPQVTPGTNVTLLVNAEVGQIMSTKTNFSRTDSTTKVINRTYYHVIGSIILWAFCRRQVC